MNNYTQEDFKKIMESKKLRSEVARQSFLHFISLYLPEYLQYQLAPFHYDIIEMVENQSYDLTVTLAFRSSGKSTLITTAGVLWAIFGVLHKRNIVIVSQTQGQAYDHLNNIRLILENYRLVKHDFGPFEEKSSQWNAKSLVIPKFDAKITAISMEQSIRGFRHGHIRPDLIIADDLEDSKSIMTEESRKKTKDLYSSEIATLGDKGTNIWMIGNFLHRDSLLMELKGAIDAGVIKGKSLFVPLLDDNGKCAWPDKFPDLESVEREKSKLVSDRIWNREYLLKEVRDDDQIIFYSDIDYFSKIPSGWEPYYQGTLASIDPAISKNETADPTGIVFADIYKFEGEHHIFFKQRYVNKRLGFRQLVEEIKELNKLYKDMLWLVEKVAFQQALGEQLKVEKVSTELVDKILGKKEMLMLSAEPIAKARVHFPMDGFTKPIEQIVNFSAEKHDDLADAITQMIYYVYQTKSPSFKKLPEYIGPVTLVNNMYRSPTEELNKAYSSNRYEITENGVRRY